jgi:restriction system protein
VKKELTIAGAITNILERDNQPLTPKAIYEVIAKESLYDFKTDNPIHIVRTQLRRRCVNLSFPSAVADKKFRLYDGGRYGLASIAPLIVTNTIVLPAQPVENEDSDLLSSVNEQYVLYLKAFKKQILGQLLRLTPIEFESFSKNLLQAYGLHDLTLTPRTNDGGIDGNGKWKFGTAELNVAFQCKRWKKNTIQRPEIQKFRGAVQGRYELGIFFTTAQFTTGAKEDSFQRGAVPIILIDGEAIVDIMIEKGFGIEREALPIFRSALDNIIIDEIA